MKWETSVEQDETARTAETSAGRTGVREGEGVWTGWRDTLLRRCECEALDAARSVLLLILNAVMSE